MRDMINMTHVYKNVPIILVAFYDEYTGYWTAEILSPESARDVRTAAWIYQEIPDMLELAQTYIDTEEREDAGKAK